MKISYIRTTTPTADTLMLAVDGQPYVLDSSHPRFEEIEALAATKFPREELAEREAELLSLINFAATALDTMRALSDRVSVKAGTIYFDGDPIENTLAEHILTMIQTGDDTWQAPVNFLENLQANPAKHVRKRLYEWISTRGLTLTPEGHVIGYKGVQNTEDNLSCTSGTNTVYVDGVEHTGHVPNPVGATVHMSRKGVDASRDAPCSQGLHVGTHAYAAGFGAKLLTVSFNPRDVVAIPSDSGYAKIRTCRYQVLQVSDVPYAGTTYSPSAQDTEQDDNTCSDCNAPLDEHCSECSECYCSDGECQEEEE